MVPSRAAGGMGHSPSSSGIFFQGDGQAQLVGNSNITSSFGNSMNSIQGPARSNLAPISLDVNNRLFNSIASSGPSVGASSLVTDANSGFSGGPQLQRSASINTESYMRLPASPLSFSSNNISLSGSSVMDGSPVVQQSPNQDPSSHQVQRSQQQGTSSATSLPTPRMGQVSLPSGARVPGSFIHEAYSMTQVQKKPRLDHIMQDDVLQQQFLQQMMQRQDQMQLSNQNPQLQALIQQKQRQHQQQILQSISPVQRAHFLQQQQQHQQQQHHQLQMKQQFQQQAVQPMSTMKRPFDGGVCSRRIMQYLYHQRQRPSDNTIAYWRKFVAEYYSPRAKKRWCLSLYDNVGYHSLGVFPQSTKESWHCDICDSKSGKGFEATFEVLPRLAEIKFGSGIIDELLFLDFPRELRSPSGIMVLEYGKAVQESIYEQLRVVREGQLRVIFAPDLKILSWEFCARRHEELLPRRLVAPQVNQLLQVAQKCQSTIAESGPDGVPQQDLQTNSNMVVTAGRQLAKTLELQSLNDLGFSKKYVRCLQISEVVNSMKELMEFIQENKVGPIDGLKNYPQQEDDDASGAKMQMQKMHEYHHHHHQQQQQQMGANMQGGLPSSTEQSNAVYKLLNSQMNNNHPSVGRGGGQTAMALSAYHNLLAQRKSPSSIIMNNSNSNANSNFNSLHHQQQQQEAGAASPSYMLQGTSGILQGSMMQNSQVQVGGAYPNNNNNNNSQFQQQQQRVVLNNNGSNGLVQQNPSQGLQQQQQQKLMPQGMNNNNSGSGLGGMMGFGNNNNTSAAAAATTTTVGSGLGNTVTGGPPPQKSNKSAYFNGGEQQKAAAGGGAELFRNLEIPEDMGDDIGNAFTTVNGFFNTSDLDEGDDDDTLSYPWKD